jgi:hypothetical protein
MLRMPFPVLVVVVLAVPLMTSARADAQVRLTLDNGLVTLEATNASPAAILQEWARVGGTKVVDGEKLNSPPVTLRLEGVPERQALDIVLRSAAGYVAAPRAAAAAGASQFDRIVVMPVSANAATARTTPFPAAPTAAMPQQVVPMVPPETGEVSDPADGQVVVDPTPMFAEDGTMIEQPVSSTEFDYANPQRYFAARAAQERAAQAAAQQGAAVEDNEMPFAPGPGGFTTGVSATPGVVPVPTPPPAPPGTAAPTQNPYGLPAGAAPGSSTAPPMEPDRSKYFNPYAPTPVQPPGS